MKKLNRTFIKGTHWALAGLISLLGYSSCGDDFAKKEDPNKEDPNQGQIVNQDGDEIACEYGTPYAKFIVSGKIIDPEQQQGLRNIRVVVPRVDHHQRPTAGFIPDQRIITNEVRDTVYTNANGDFEYKYTGFPSNDSINVILQFEEASETPRFERDSAKVTFFSSELREGDGKWYGGVAQKELTIRMQKKKDE